MDINQAEILAHALISIHGLDELGWEFRWDNSRRRFGQCRYRKKEVGLSLHLTKTNSEEQVKDTILHEISHGISFIRYGVAGRGHGSLWKQVCLEIGAKPERCYGSDVIRAPRYLWKCTKCGETLKSNKLPKAGRHYWHCLPSIGMNLIAKFD